MSKVLLRTLFTIGSVFFLILTFRYWPILIAILWLWLGWRNSRRRRFKAIKGVKDKSA